MILSPLYFELSHPITIHSIAQSMGFSTFSIQDVYQRNYIAVGLPIKL